MGATHDCSYTFSPLMRIIFMVVAVAGSTVAGLPAQSDPQLHRSKNSPTDTAPVSSVETDPRLHEDKNSPNVTTPLSSAETGSRDKNSSPLDAKKLRGMTSEQKTTTGATCHAHTDCPCNQYCDSTHSCYRCGYISATTCDATDHDCCSTDFLYNCPSNPRQCGNQTCLVALAAACADKRGDVFTCAQCAGDHQQQLHEEKCSNTIISNWCAHASSTSHSAQATCLGTAGPCGARPSIGDVVKVQHSNRNSCVGDMGNDIGTIRVDDHSTLPYELTVDGASSTCWLLESEVLCFGTQRTFVPCTTRPSIGTEVKVHAYSTSRSCVRDIDNDIGTIRTDDGRNSPLPYTLTIDGASSTCWLDEWEVLCFGTPAVPGTFVPCTKRPSIGSEVKVHAYSSSGSCVRAIDNDIGTIRTDNQGNLPYELTIDGSSSTCWLHEYEVLCLATNDE